MNAKMWKESVDGTFDNSVGAVYELGGGGGNSSAQMMMAMQQQEAQRAAMEANRRQQEMEEARQREEAEKLARETEKKEAAALFGRNVDTAMGGARNFATGKLNSLGIEDRWGIMPAFETELASARTSVPEGATDIGTYINPSNIFTRAYEGQRGVERKKLGSGADEFIGSGFEKKALADTADDSLIDLILGGQQSEAQQAIDRARSRGQLNDRGFDKAVSLLGQQAAAGRSRFQDLGLGAINTAREGLLSEAQGIRDQIDKYDFTDKFNLGTARTSISDAIGGARKALEGQVRTAIGGDSAFDVGNILGSAGTYQGIGNNPLVSAFLPTESTSPESDKEKKRRTLGTAGVF